MQARDIMTTSVITADPAMSVSDIAKLLLDYRISAVPVLDENGKLAGVVSEGDLMRRSDLGTERERSWWLEMFGATDRPSDYIKSHGRKAEDVMTRDVITVSPDTSVADIAATLERKHIKRVPVIEDGKLVGLVSRSNLLGALTVAHDSKAVSADDATIREQMLAALRDAGLQIHTLNILVKDGAVRIYGGVRSETEKAAVRVVADNVPGVKSLEDETAVVLDSVVGGY